MLQPVRAPYLNVFFFGILVKIIAFKTFYTSNRYL